MPSQSPMDLALSLADEAAAHGEAPVAAVVMEGDVVLAAERNRMKALVDPTAHAEMLAIRAALAKRGTGRLDGCDLYVTLEPCAMCAGAIYWSGVGRVVFGLSNARLYGEVLADGPMALRLDSRDVFAAGERQIAVASPLLEDEAAAVVADIPMP